LVLSNTHYYALHTHFSSTKNHNEPFDTMCKTQMCFLLCAKKPIHLNGLWNFFPADRCCYHKSPFKLNSPPKPTVCHFKWVETFFIFYSGIKAKKSLSLLVLTTRQNCKQTTMHGLSPIWTTIRTKLHNTWIPYQSYISEVISTLLQTHKYRIPKCIPSP
jgi:hypothetical protein